MIILERVTQPSKSIGWKQTKPGHRQESTNKPKARSYGPQFIHHSRRQEENAQDETSQLMGISVIQSAQVLRTIRRKLKWRWHCQKFSGVQGPVSPSAPCACSQQLTAASTQSLTPQPEHWNSHRLSQSMAQAQPHLAKAVVVARIAVKSIARMADISGADDLLFIGSRPLPSPSKGSHPGN